MIGTSLRAVPNADSFQGFAPIALADPDWVFQIMGEPSLIIQPTKRTDEVCITGGTGAVLPSSAGQPLNPEGRRGGNRGVIPMKDGDIRLGEIGAAHPNRLGDVEIFDLLWSIAHFGGEDVYKRQPLSRPS